MNSHVLGVSFSGEDLYGALVEQTDEGGPVVRFTVSSTDSETIEPEFPGDSDFSEGGSETHGSGVESDEDVTIQFGDDGGPGEPLGEPDEAEETDGGVAVVQSHLSTLLDACEGRGYDDPEIALCSPVGEIDEVELHLPEEEADSSTGVRGKSLPADRSVLLGLLKDQYEGVVADERVGFLPLHPIEDGTPRVLALIARPGETILSTMATLQGRTSSRRLRVELLESELSLYEGLAGLVQDSSPASDDTTAVVRVGVDDTFVLFMRGDTLLKFEHLPELTADDPVETICSRVLLLRDEYGVGHVRHLLLALEENEEALASSFREYFPEANTEPIRGSLPTSGEEDNEKYTTAVGVALRHLQDSDVETSFRPVNLLPRRYTASSFRFPVELSVPVLLTLIGLTTLVFVWYYMENAQAINERHSRLRVLNQQIEQVDQPALEQRVEAIQTTATRYEEGLNTLDNLVDGSNKWSRALATLTTSVEDVSGLSIRQWRGHDGGLVLTGRANDRTKVVDLVRQLDGEIDALSFTEVREIPLFDFKIRVPLDTVRPDAVQYWDRQQTTRLGSAVAREGVASESNSRAEAGMGATPGDRPKPAGRKQAPDAGPWTIVVASLSNQESAVAVQRAFSARLSRTGHQIRVHYCLENGRYRVGLGGFDSRERAHEALRRLQADLPADAWIHDRIPA